MKKTIFILIIFLKAIDICAQGLNADSLNNLLLTTQADTSRLMLMAQLSSQLSRSYPDSAIALAQQGLILAKKINYQRGELYLTSGLAVASASTGDYPTAIELFLSKLKLVENSNDVGLKISYYAQLASTYRDQGDFTEALKYANKILSFVQQANACLMCRANYTLFASIFLENHQLDSAKIYSERALQYQSINGLDGWVYGTAGRIQTELKNYDTALNFYRQSVSAHIKENNLKDLANSYNYISYLFEKTRQRDSAIYYANQSLSVARPRRFAREILQADILLSGLYEEHNTDSAYYYYKQAIVAKDTLYNQSRQRQILNFRFNEELRQQEIQEAETKYQNRVRTYILSAGLIVVLLITAILYRNNRLKQKAKIKIEQSYEKLKLTQAQLIQSEKMASLGELTAGIAHEIQNPLNFVNNFSEVNGELISELVEEVDKGNYDEVKVIAVSIKDNEEKIKSHGKRADAIVKGMLQHSRVNTGQKELTDINALCDEYLRLSYHGMRAKDKSFSATLQTDFDASIGKINIVPQDIGRVLLNLYNNAFYATAGRLKAHSSQLKADSSQCVPTVTVVTKKHNDKIEITVKDNGAGIPQNIVDKIFQPFFTTKPTGEGTGLGLSLSYDIIKAHGGEIKVETKEGQGSEFIVLLST